MIIKSMSRKKASFAQLIDYMNKELSSPHIIGHNIYTHERSTQADIINEFEQNAEHLPKRKNGNYLYHEVISFEKNELDQERMDEIIIELAELYLSERAPKQLAYAVIHRDTEKPHIHFCISANELGSDTRKRLTKKKFAELQQNLERYAQEQFPELETKLVYTKQRDNEKAKTTSREQELKKRTGKVSQKDLLKNKLHGLFELSNTKQELDEHLEKEGYRVYTRGKNAGIEKTDTGKKHRFNTLGVLEHYLSALELFDSLEKDKRAQAQNNRREAEQNAAQAQQRREAERRQAKEQEQQQKAAEEAQKQAEAERQAEQLAEEQRTIEEARRQAEQRQAAERLAEQQREAAERQQQAASVQKPVQAKEPNQQQRAEYEIEQTAAEKRREAVTSRRTTKLSKQTKQQAKPSKTQRRESTEQVKKPPEKKRGMKNLFSGVKDILQGKNKPHVKDKHRTATQDQKLAESKAKIKGAKSEKEHEYRTRREKDSIMNEAQHTKEADVMRDRLSELDTLFKDKDKHKDRDPER